MTFSWSFITWIILIFWLFHCILYILIKRLVEIFLHLKLFGAIFSNLFGFSWWRSKKHFDLFDFTRAKCTICQIDIFFRVLFKFINNCLHTFYTYHIFQRIIWEEALPWFFLFDLSSSGIGVPLELIKWLQWFIDDRWKDCLFRHCLQHISRPWSVLWWSSTLHTKFEWILPFAFAEETFNLHILIRLDPILFR